MARRRGTDYEGLIKALAGSVLLICIAGFGIRGAADAFKMATATLVAVAVLVGVIIVVATVISFLTRLSIATVQQRQLQLVASGTASKFEISEALDALDWFQLEKLVGALFEAKGNHVELRGGANADGGIDIVVQSASSSAAVQCKHWAKWKCGPAVVRELIGAMAHEGFRQGFLICRVATEAAWNLADQERITIVDHDGLVDRIYDALEAGNSVVRDSLFDPPKLCPKCGAEMVLRVASKGRGAGSEFWGCSTYPKCNQTMRVW